MTKKQMRHWLATGNGKAIRWIQEHGEAGLEQTIIQACTGEVILDVDINDTPAWYWAFVFQLTGRPDFYVEQILLKLPRLRHKRAWELVRYTVCYLAEQGNEACCAYIEANWAKDLEAERFQLVDSMMRRLKGKAFGEAIDHLMQSMSPSLDKPHCLRMVLDIGEEHIGKEQTRQAATLLAEKYPNLGQTLTAVGAPAIELDKPDIEALPLSAIREWNSRQRSKYALRFAFRNASKQKLHEASQLLSEDLDPKEALSWLSIFRFNRFYGNVEWLIRWLEHESTRKECFHALANIRNAKVRKAGLNWIEHEQFRDAAIQVFRKNFKLGDEDVLLSWVKLTKDINQLHWQLLSLAGVACANLAGDWNSVLRFALDNTPCPHCRGVIAKDLDERGALTMEELLDLSYDNNEDNRVWAKDELAKQEQATE